MKNHLIEMLNAAGYANTGDNRNYIIRSINTLIDSGLLEIEHAFVKVGDKYIDPTFERALHRDVCKEMYAALIELDPETMAKYQLETGYYGDLYQYDYLCKHRPEIATKMRARNQLRE